MKEEFHNDTIDTEQLLRTKSWNQLSTEERVMMSELFSGEAEYERVRSMMDQLRSGSGIEEEELQPSENVRENLLAAFEDEQRRRRVLWWNSLGFWFRDQLRLDIPAMRIAVAGVILIIGIVAVMQLTGDGKVETPVANNQKIQPGSGENSPKEDVVKSNGGGIKLRPESEDIKEVPQIVFPPMNQGPVVHVPVQPSPELPAPVINDAGTEFDSTKAVASNPVADTSAVISPVATFTNATCFGVNDGTATVLSGGTPAYTYTWNATTVNGTTFSLSPSNANVVGVYTVVVPNCRSLANDQPVIEAMFSMK